ncbi:LacI family DNA-binding transcriptional regulator [Pollutimonas bauzanensis]|uniref:LacI family DNA-binding transcriptional regulator n=1 Tax=Pollutimonas bauzanensis TaxID=658167 RepID=UPI0033421EC6
MQKRGAVATLSDVAALAGVDVSTVSRVLGGNKNQRVREETRQRITAAAQTLNYQPNLSARGLRTSRMYSLGIAVPQLDNPVYYQIILGAERAAFERGYSLVIAHIEENAADDAAYARIVRTNRVDGLLVTTLDDNSAILRAVKHAGVPFILLNRKVKGVRNCFYFDSRAAARLATQHLIKLGHRRIAHLSGQVNPSTGLGRFAGYCDALQEAGIPFDPDLVAVSGYTVAGGAEAMKAILAKNQPLPTAVFPLTLTAATGAMMVLHANRISVPEQMSVITVHDGPMAEVMFPQLTTVRLPVEQMGYEGAQALIDLIDGQRKEAKQQFDPIELILRSSTAAPAPAAGS